MRGFNNQTIRMTVRTSIGGRRIRIRIANAYGSVPVTVGAAHVALRSKESEIVPGSDRALAFDGKPGCTLDQGMVILSDPLDFNLPPLSDLAISLYFPGETGPPTSHGAALHTTYISKEGDFSGAAAIADATTTESYYWLAGVDVLAPPDAALIIALGDSITDGIRSTNESNHTWPALLAARLAARKETANIAVGNMGISGNRVLTLSAGPSAVARFDRDVLSQSGVKWVMLMDGINDIGTGRPTEPVTLEQLTGAYKQIIEQAHTHGIQVIGCTLTPFLGAPIPEGGRRTDPRSREQLDPHQRRIRRGGGFRSRHSGPERPEARARGVRPRRPPAPQRYGLPSHGRCRRSLDFHRQARSGRTGQAVARGFSKRRDAIYG